MTTSEKGKSRRTGRPGIVRMLVSAVVRLIAASVVVFGATLAYKHLLATSPTAARAKPPRQARLVEAVELKKSAHTVTVKQNGQVIPAQEVTLQPQVSGKIVEVSEYVVPGTAVKAGQKLIGIDRRDYEILVKQRHADVVRAQRDLKAEHGNQAVSRQEYEILGEVLLEQDRELVLREPQLAAAEAALESAQAAYEKAQLDLGRCEIAAPFNAVVQQRHVDLGATVSSNAPLVTLIATDEAWVEVKVPIGQLAWLAIPRANGQAGSDVTLHNPLAWGADNVRTGRVLRLYGEVERQGQMAKLLVLVDDPLCLKPENQGRPKLLLDSYVSAEIEGRRLTDVFEIPRPYFREGDAVWIMNEKDELDIRPVEVAFRGQETVYVSGGVVEGDRLVTTDIAAPVAGMPLRLDGGSGPAGGDTGAGGGQGPRSGDRRSGS